MANVMSAGVGSYETKSSSVLDVWMANPQNNVWHFEKLDFVLYIKLLPARPEHRDEKPPRCRFSETPYEKQAERFQKNVLTVWTTVFFQLCCMSLFYSYIMGS